MKRKNHNTKRLSVFFVIFLILASALSIIVIGQPVIEDMDYTPKNPSSLSTITFNATVTGENPTVYVFVEECRDDSCYPDVQNVTMTKIDATHYKKTVKLKHAFANIVHYQIIVKSKGVWYKSVLEEFNLGKENESNAGDEKDTPGFEGTFLVLSILILVLITLRKRNIT